MKPVPFAEGPIEILWFQQALHINPFGPGQKICSFDCVYCYLGPTEIRLNRIEKEFKMPPVTEVIMAVRTWIAAHPQELSKLEAIVISGNGEPTLYPELVELIEQLKQVRDAHHLKIPVVVATNGAHLDQRRIAEALNLADERVLKLDSSSEKQFKTYNRPLSRATLETITGNAQRLNDVVVQALFASGETLQTPMDLDEWAETVALIKPKFVWLETLRAGLPTAYPEAQPCTEDWLERVKMLLVRKVQLQVRTR